MGPFRSTRTARHWSPCDGSSATASGRQTQGADHLEPVGGQPLDEAPAAQLRAGELARLALADQHLLRLDRVALPQFLQAGRR